MAIKAISAVGKRFGHDGCTGSASRSSTSHRILIRCRSRRAGYNPISYAGVTVFADQSQTLSFKPNEGAQGDREGLARAAGNLVKPGTTSDVYSVNAAIAKQTQAARPAVTT